MHLPIQIIIRRLTAFQFGEVLHLFSDLLFASIVDNFFFFFFFFTCCNFEIMVITDPRHLAYTAIILSARVITIHKSNLLRQQRGAFFHMQLIR